MRFSSLMGISDNIYYMNDITFRIAHKNDMHKIIELIHDDFLGKERECLNDSSYEKAFDEILSTQNNYLFVMSQKQNIIGTFHITIIPSMPLLGSKRANIESVHVASNLRGMGYGSLMMQWIIHFAKENQCQICQLTTNKLRIDAQRFYIKNGFVATHEGMKLKL